MRETMGVNRNRPIFGKRFRALPPRGAASDGPTLAGRATGEILAIAMPTLAYYVSGHGFGHARRSAQVLRAMVALRPDVRVVVRTAALGALFSDVSNTIVSAPTRPFDPGVVERDTLSIDPVGSLMQLADMLDRRAELVRAEAEFLAQIGASLVLADIPFLTGDAAQIAEIPCLAIGNFTWDWIFEPFAKTAQDREMVEEIRRSYRKMDALLQLPLGHPVTCFEQVIQMPLVASRSRRDRAEALARLGVGADDRRPRILVALRGGVSARALRHAAAGAPAMLFFVNQSLANPPSNLRLIDPANGIDFTTLLAACDAVISKVGYGILSDCIANGVALLFPPREGFREDDISTEVCPRYLRMRPISIGDFTCGNWGAHLSLLLEQPAPPCSIEIDGETVIAQCISARL